MSTILATTYTVYPTGFDEMVMSDKDHWTLTVTLRDREQALWAITHGGSCMNSDGRFDYEPQSSSRTEKWKRRYRFPLAEALDLATAHVDTARWNGRTAQEASDFVAARLANQP